MRSSQKYNSFTCHCAPNGGWVVEHTGSSHGMTPSLIGAFSNAYDMLKFLEEKATPNGLEIEPEKPREMNAGGAA